MRGKGIHILSICSVGNCHDFSFRGEQIMNKLWLDTPYVVTGHQKFSSSHVHYSFTVRSFFFLYHIFFFMFIVLSCLPLTENAKLDPITHLIAEDVMKRLEFDDFLSLIH